MSFSDSDWTSDAAAAASTRRDHTLAWTLALGVVIGAAIASLVFVVLERFASPHEAPAALAAAPRSAPAATRPANQGPAAVVDAAPPSAGPAGPASQTRPAETPAASAALPVEPAPVVAAPPATLAASAARPSAEELRRKERAWAAYYKRPAACDGNPSTDQLIECANHFIRSKREFDERWKAGNL